MWEEHGSFLRDSVPAYIAIILRAFLTTNGVAVLHFPQYSHDMVSWDSFLFPQLKIKLVGRQFDMIVDL